MPDARMVCYNFAMHVTELQSTFHPVERVQGGTDLTLEIRGTLVAFNYANVFRVYHKQVTGKEPKLMHYGLTIGSQDRLHREVTRRLSPTICYDEVHFAVALDDMDHESGLRTIDERGKRIPRHNPEFENGMHHDLMFDEKEKMNPKYLSFAPETELRQNYLQRDEKAGKQFLGNHFKGKVQNRQPYLFCPLQFSMPNPVAIRKRKSSWGSSSTRVKSSLVMSRCLCSALFQSMVTGDCVLKEFIMPYYKSLKNWYINSIRIEVKYDTGQDIDFTLGRFICALHFRQCGFAV